MKELILEYLLLSEIGDTRLSSENIKTDKTYTGNKSFPQTKTSTSSEHTKYDAHTFADDEKHHDDHSGVTHDVSWDKISDNKSKVLSHALALHHNYVENHTKPGDVVTNIPLGNKKDSGVDTKHNKREEIYRKKAGFSERNADDNAGSHRGRQFGIVRQHPVDHPDESKRGKNYLEPIDKPDFNRFHSPIASVLARRRLKQPDYN